MKRTKNIFKKILMVLCTFALFVPMAFGLVACDSTPSGNGNEGGYGKSAVEDDILLYAKTIVAGIDYIENTQRDTTNILASMIAASGEVSKITGKERDFKLTIKVQNTPVYELFFDVQKQESEESPATKVYDALEEYENSKIYKLDGNVQASGGTYDFKAERVVNEKGAVTDASTIKISKQGNGDNSLTATGTIAQVVTFSNGESTETFLCSVQFGTKETELAEATVGEKQYTAVANSEDTEPTLTLSSDNSNLTGKLVLNGADTKYKIIIKSNITSEGETQS